MASHPEPTDGGERMAAMAPRLRLLLTHLASPSVRARVGVDDLVQEVFLRALAHKDPLPPDDPDLYRFLVHLARHAVIDAVRAIRAQKRTSQEPDVPLLHGDWSHFGRRVSQVMAETAGPATRVAQDEAQERLRQAFAALDPDHRRVIGLRQLLGLSARDTAQRMGRSETAVHSLFRRALIAWEATGRQLLGENTRTRDE